MPSSVNTPSTEACPLCSSSRTHHFAHLQHGTYSVCAQCQYTFLHRAHWLPEAVEKEHYDRHENHVDDPHYRAFLNRLAAPLIPLLATGDEGIDMGCGPGPALAAMLTEQGYPTEHYDPLYFPNETLLTRQYHFVTSTEVVEHLREPQHTWEQFKRLVRPGGYLAIMTSWRVTKEAFPRWHYHRDPTHIGFYQPETFSWLAQEWQWSVQFPAANVCIFQRPRY